jgi:tetratricopeptide (TPR) repeat protein
MKFAIIILFIFLVFTSRSLPLPPSQSTKCDKELKDGNYDAAIDCYSNIIKSNPRDLYAVYYRGLAYLYSDKGQEAFKDFNKSIEIDSNFADPYNNRGLIYAVTGEDDKAIEDFNRAIKLDSNFQEVYINRASSYITMNLDDLAMIDLNRAIMLSEKNPEAYYQRARVYYRRKDLDSAITDFSTSIEKGMNNVQVWYSRGNAYYKKGEYLKAVDDYSNALMVDSTDNEALNNRAMAYDKLGMKEKASADRSKLTNFVKKSNLYPPIDSLKFKTFTPGGGEFSLVLPETWHSIEKYDQDFIEYIISPEEINNDSSAFSTGVTITMHFNMQRQYGVSQPNELLEFWEGSLVKSAQDYKAYEIISKKIFHKGPWSGQMHKTRLEFKEFVPPLRMYEVGLAQGDTLIVFYFQSIENEFSYYSKIFDKAIDSIILK